MAADDEEEVSDFSGAAEEPELSEPHAISERERVPRRRAAEPVRRRIMVVPFGSVMSWWVNL
jgi:hypothetical protein